MQRAVFLEFVQPLARALHRIVLPVGLACLLALLAPFTPPAQAATAWSLSPTVSGTPAKLSVSGKLVVADADRGRTGMVFVAALLPDGSIYALSNGSWARVSGTAIPAYFTGTLGEHTLNVLSGQDATSIAGTTVYAGYGTSAQAMLDEQRYALLYAIPGSYAGPATAGDWLTFTLNVQDFAYPDRSAATVDRVISLHERYRLPVDIYLTDTLLATYEASYPALMTRLRSSPFVGLNYHIRPPKPYYTGYDWAGLAAMSSAEQLATIRNYETHVTDLVTGQPGSAAGGFARLKQYTGGNPVIAAFQTDAALYTSVSQVFRELGATMTISHSAPYINLGTRYQSLYIRPEHHDLKLFQSPGQSAGSLIEAGFTAARAAAGATSPYVVGVKMHDNDFFAQASAWTTTYVNAPRTPNWNTSTLAGLKSDADMQAQWTLYEGALAWADANRTRVAAINALGLGAALAAAPAMPLLYVSGTMHIESNPARWPDPDKLIAFFQRATAAGKVGTQTTGMRWSIGADVGWLNGEKRAGEIIRTLSALGVEWDVHVHSAADAAAAAQRIVALGGTPNTVVSGVQTADIDTFRSTQNGTGGYTWKAASLWGVVREGSHSGGSEDLSNGLWLPRSSSDWQAHDPAAALVVVGGGSRNLSTAETLAGMLTQGGYTAPVYSATVMVDQLTFTVVDAVNASTTTDGIDKIEAFASRLGVLPQVRWASLSATATAWRSAGSVPSRIANTQ
ncbi:MAG: hypothetical protein HY855_17840 [Burkholderiales bacterium]|nr:hypothetical protein [Burkholderiales bacterium]